jgi:hypothetical protein
MWEALNPVIMLETTLYYIKNQKRGLILFISELFIFIVFIFKTPGSLIHLLWYISRSI